MADETRQSWDRDERSTGRGPSPSAADTGTIARRHLEALAREPRPTGSESAARARAYCTRVLSSLGFTVDERPFTYSALPGRYGTPSGGVVALATICGAAVAGHRGNPGIALGVLAIMAVLLAIAAAWLARRGTIALSLLRSRGVNLEARRGGRTPVVWLVAHVDSKSQPVPLAARAGGIVLLSLAWIAALLLAIVDTTSGRRDVAGWWWIAAAAMLGAIPVIATLVGTRSAGAVDNASGVATVLAAASRLPAECDVGVLITDAEELGLAGARAWCNNHPPGVVLNCDGVDDGGALMAMYTRAYPARVAAALLQSASRNGQRMRVRRLLPGVLVDGVAFADAGWQAVTLSRGTLATLRRIHTVRDDVGAMRGDGIPEAALVMAAAARMLTEDV